MMASVYGKSHVLMLFCFYEKDKITNAEFNNIELK